MPGFSGVRRRSPSQKERRKKKGLIQIRRTFNRARAQIFEIGRQLGLSGKKLVRYVDQHLTSHQQV